MTTGGPIYTEDFKQLKKSDGLSLVIAIVSLLVALIALYFSILPYFQKQNTQSLLAQKETCAKAGAMWVHENPYPGGMQIDEYTYSSDLNTCLIYESDSYDHKPGDQIIFDIYSNKLIASCTQTMTSCPNFYNELNKYFPTSSAPLE